MLSPSPLLETTRSVSATGEPVQPTAVLSEWEQVQQKVGAFRDLLDRNSDGYLGLSEALLQSGPDQVWCSSLDAAIADFKYLNDPRNAHLLIELKASQGCP